MVNIKSRAAWGARPASFGSTSWGARTGFTVHYSAGPTSQTPRQIQNYHMDGNGWSDVGYNFLVDKSGTAYEGRGWLGVGAHAAPHNTSHIGVCFIGRDGDATPAAKATIRALYDEACKRAGRTLSKTYHGGLPGNSTSCPGAELRAWVQNGMPASDGGGSNGMGFDYMVNLKEGDKGEAVKALQTSLRHAGFGSHLGTYGPNKDGVDGEYGAGTSKAVLAARKWVGSGATSGKKVTGPAAAQIFRAVARREAQNAK